VHTPGPKRRLLDPEDCDGDAEYVARLGLASGERGRAGPDGRPSQSQAAEPALKGLDNVRAEFSLTALVYNLRRAINILGVGAMMGRRV
jgi:hypothetical protein